MNNSIVQKKSEAQDWHRADILAALRKAGWSLQQLSLAHGMGKATFNRALDKPYPRVELIIATQIGKKPEEIWPSRYTNGVNVRVGGRRPMRGILVRELPASNTQAQAAG